MHTEPAFAGAITDAATAREAALQAGGSPGSAPRGRAGGSTGACLRTGTHGARLPLPATCSAARSIHRSRAAPLTNSSVPATKGNSHARPISSLVLIIALSGAAAAEEHAPGGLSIERAWSFELPPVAPNGAAYFRVENGGRDPDRLVSAHSPIAGRAEMHAHEMDGGVMQMHQVHSVEVPAQGGVTFEPGGLHMMLLGLKKPLVAGESFPLVLGFDKAGTIEVSVEIKSR